MWLSNLRSSILRFPPTLRWCQRLFILTAASMSVLIVELVVGVGGRAVGVCLHSELHDRFVRFARLRRRRLLMGLSVNEVTAIELVGWIVVLEAICTLVQILHGRDVGSA